MSRRCRLSFCVATILVQYVYTLIYLHQQAVRDAAQINEQQFMDVPAITKCTCVDCNEDKVCGGLWLGNRYPGMPSEEEAIHIKMHIVVSHCKKSLDWMPKYLEGFKNVASIHVISKCGQEVKGAPNETTTVVVPNVGRCDHAFAYYITEILPQLVTQRFGGLIGLSTGRGSPATTTKYDKSIIVFLKDTTMTKIYQNGAAGGQLRHIDLKSLVRIASSVNGFACGLDLGGGNGKLSAYHDVNTLYKQALRAYNKGGKDYQNGDVVPFRSNYSTLGDFYKALNATSPSDLVQVCYGGVFATSTEHIFKQDMNVWRTLEKALERGDNIQEGHFAERSWGPLLATPLKPFQIEALRNHSTSVREQNWAMHGTLTRDIIAPSTGT
mmetsp:Transcript_1514/g.2258  ORF Transcript_1514/g.2258 Transcript_1514/m.2258 type:complete len:382 (+) Transcript_1514:222-1367(+)